MVLPWFLCSVKQQKHNALSTSLSICVQGEELSNNAIQQILREEVREGMT